jgi:hypothetical protein
MHTNMNRYGVDGVRRVRELEAEIERLTAQFRLLTTSTEQELLAERERLWGENTRLRHLDYENAGLQAEVERFREALNEIIAEGYDSDFAVEVARNALGIS